MNILNEQSLAEGIFPVPKQDLVFMMKTISELAIIREGVYPKELDNFIEALQSSSHLITGTGIERYWRLLEEMCDTPIGILEILSQAFNKIGGQFRRIEQDKNYRLSKIDKLKNHNVYRWIEGFLHLVSADSTITIPRMKSILFTYINNEYLLDQNTPLIIIIFHLINQGYSGRFSEFKSGLLGLREIECASFKEYLEQVTDLSLGLEISNRLNNRSEYTQETIEDLCKKSFYNGLLAKHKRVLLYTTTQNNKIPDLIKVLKYHHKLEALEEKESEMLAKKESINTLCAYSEQISFPSKSNPEVKHQCTLHPRSNHSESECKLKKTLKKALHAQGTQPTATKHRKKSLGPGTKKTPKPKRQRPRT
ncbi:hypothetical protein NEOKW01_0077 [Nematocida sp. AWRm80]|nr:hypothetical protein NEOKW01_0077 [Nematocida sp. AWRm80]